MKATRSNLTLGKITLLLLAAVLALAVLAGGCAGNRGACDDLVIDLADGDRGAAFRRLHEAGLEAIPCLIEAIDDTTKTTTLDLVNPISSYIPEEAFENYTGVVAAYAIELILAKDSLAVTPPGYSFLLEPGDYIYWCGVIRHRGEEQALTVEDLHNVKTAYRRWWQQRNGLPLDSLRSEWEADVRPLSGSEYYWL